MTVERETVTLQVIMTPDLLERLKAAAAAEDRSVSNYARRALSGYLDLADPEIQKRYARAAAR